MHLYKLVLKKQARFHLPHERPYSIGADTLFSALVNNHAQLYGEEKTEEFICDLHISSAFLGVRDGKEEIRFFPAPRIQAQGDDPLTAKKIKKASFFAYELLTEVMKGRPLPSDLYFSLNGQYLAERTAEGLFSRFDISPIRRPSNVLHRVSSRSMNLFFADEWLFRADGNSRLYFFFLTTTPSPELSACVRLLCDEGIGGKRTAGAGVFSHMEEESWIPPEDWEDRLLLSPTLPDRSDLVQEAFLTYRFTVRSGYSYRPGFRSFRKPVFRAFEEGSVCHGPVKGTLQSYDIGGATNYCYLKGFCIGGRS